MSSAWSLTTPNKSWHGKHDHHCTSVDWHAGDKVDFGVRRVNKCTLKIFEDKDCKNQTGVGVAEDWVGTLSAEIRGFEVKGC